MFLMQRDGDEYSPDALFGEAVSMFRRMRDLSQREFADRLRDAGMPVDASAVSRIEGGSRSVRISEASIIADTLEIAVTDLLQFAMTPTQVFRSVRRRVDGTLHQVQESIVDAGFALATLVEMVEEDPRLLGTLSDDNMAPPADSRDYMQWIKTRMSKWTVVEDDLATFPSEGTRQGAIEIIAALADMMLVSSDGKLTIITNADGEPVGQHPEDA